MAFHPDATNLDRADKDAFDDVYVKNLATGDITLASTSDEGVKGRLWSSHASMSTDGTIVSFHSNADNLDPAEKAAAKKGTAR